MRVRVFMFFHFFEFLMVVFAVREVEMLEGSERKELREEMNGYDFNEEAIRAQNALQFNWYPDPLQYMNSYQSWNGFDGFWQNGVVLEAIANVRAYTESTKCDKVVHSGLRSVEELSIAYPPEPSYDDMAWYVVFEREAREFQFFSHFHYVTRISLTLLTHATKTFLEKQRSNPNAIVT